MIDRKNNSQDSSPTLPHTTTRSMTMEFLALKWKIELEEAYEEGLTIEKDEFTFSTNLLVDSTPDTNTFLIRVYKAT